MPDFEEIYGKPLGQMDAGEKEIALFSYLERIDNHLERLNGKTKSIPRVEKLTWAGALIIPTMIAWLSYLTRALLGR